MAHSPADEIYTLTSYQSFKVKVDDGLSFEIPLTCKKLFVDQMCLKILSLSMSQVST